jgi:repressor LexA
VSALTPRQVACLEAIQEHLRANRGQPPTYRELAEALGLRSTNAVNDVLKALARKGYIARGFGSARSVWVIKNADGTPACCPACGRAA